MCLVPFGRSAGVFRAQSLCYPPFVALVILLCDADICRSRRVYLVLPILALWANLHGSVVAAAAIVCLYAIFGPWRRDGDTRGGLLLAGGASPAVFASPFAFQLRISTEASSSIRPSRAT